MATSFHNLFSHLETSPRKVADSGSNVSVLADADEKVTGSRHHRHKVMPNVAGAERARIRRLSESLDRPTHSAR